MKPNLLIFLPTPNEVQRFILGGAFVKLENHFSVTYALLRTDEKKLIRLIRGAGVAGEIQLIDLDPQRFQAWSKLFKAACHRYATKSRSFALRINAERYGGATGTKRLLEDIKYSSIEHGATSRISAARRIRDFFTHRQAKSLVDSAKPSVRTRMFDKEEYRKFRKKTLNKLGPNVEIENLIDRTNPLAVVVPSSLLDPFCNEVIWVCSEKSVPSIILQSGWDNLSSKGIVQHKPDYMGVWGPQSEDHAVSIQGMSAGQVFQLGAPHYEALLKSEPGSGTDLRGKLGLHDDEKLVLFGGSFRQFDETALLQEIDAYIENRGLACKVLYRPHPYRLDRDGEADFLETEWKNICFDPEMMERYRNSKLEKGYIKRERPLYSMQYLAEVLEAVDVVMSPMSTLLVEAMVTSTPTLAIAFSDNKHAYSAATASEMTHFEPLKRHPEAIIWCDDRSSFLSEFERLLNSTTHKISGSEPGPLLDEIVITGPKSFNDRLFAAVADEIVPPILKDRKRIFEKSASISHHYGADRIMQKYVGCDEESKAYVPGYWMHGWLPEYFNSHYGLISLHKRFGIKAANRVRAHEKEKETELQFVSRQDQADFLSANGYKRAHAIGLPFVYLPDVNVERRPGSLLVMPPHGRKEHSRSNELARAYVESIVKIRHHFADVSVCVTEKDYIRGDWRHLFQDADIPVLIGASHSDPDTLLRMKEVLSSFEFVTTNSFGSHIAYAAACGAKVSVYGPYCEWREEKKTHASQMFPELRGTLVEFQSEERLKREFPDLFSEPFAAKSMQAWGEWQLGMHERLTPERVATLFGW